MAEIRNVLNEILNEGLEQIILSDTRNKEAGQKVRIRPVRIKGELLFQETLYRGTQVFHCNCTAKEVAERILCMLGQSEEPLTEARFAQAQISAAGCAATALVSKKGKMTLKVRQLNGEPAKQRAAGLEHNKVKQYILQEGKPIAFLVGLGVQSPDGKVTKARYDKFRQINRYLEFIEDVLEELPSDRTIRIIDFGCGKSYLTFAMYYYLHELQGRDVRITGLDLKEEVIDHCNELARSCGYEQLQFEKGDISTYTGADQVDMVVTLHACDTATDYALEKAVKWGAKVIMAVPCCQHEVNRQIHCRELKPVLQYGLIRERMSALITDAVRANLLTNQGYDTQILEFIDMEHTPKNLLIRAVKRERMRPKRMEENKELLDFLGISPTLEKLLEEL